MASTPSVNTARAALMDRLVAKSGGVRTEATIQADVRMLLLDPELGLAEEHLDVQLEAQVERQRRIDVEVGCTVIEVKRSLRSTSILSAAVLQLGGYVRARSAEMGQRYVGILTDGEEWIAFHEVDGALQEATRHKAVVGGQGATNLLRWLEGVLATKRAVKPTPKEIADRLGASSSSHALDVSTLAALYADGRGLPAVQLKRELWANLLRSALGTQFVDSDELFLEHTLLVNSAEIIAHLVLDLPAQHLSAATLLSGDQFVLAGLHGVVDRDFFDWVLEVPGGEGYVTALARRLARFDWSLVEHDVLKVLYEEVIAAETRKALGEYYTPDWLANRMVQEVVTDPLNQRVLDPSCGSGTFVFYAVRRFLDAAQESGVSLERAMTMVSSRVMGIDLHPVAVALARVTYLLALGRERLNTRERGSLSVPVYLGDSLGWDQTETLMNVNELVIPTEVGDQLLSGELRFADHLLRDGARFDHLVQALVDESGRASGKATNRLSEGTVRRLAIATGDLPLLNANFVRLRELHEAKRDHIWSYYIRNAARPAWLARPENRVDVLVGNPPWLSYRHMTRSMQRRFKAMAKDRDFWHDERTATHQDLAGLFVARAVERYLKNGGTLAFVVPNSVIDRDYWGGFRRGRFDGARVQFRPSWDLRRIRPHLFPRGSAVIFGVRGTRASVMPSTAVNWSGRAPHRHASLATASQLHQVVDQLTHGSENEERSPYSARFSQGASLIPRMMFRVMAAPSSSLGVPLGRMAVRSKRSTTEKRPWKTLADMTGTVETEFLRPTVLGEQVVPFRVFPAETFVLPLTTTGDVLGSDNPRIDAYPGLANWMRAAEDLWTEHGESQLSLDEQIDYMRKLSQQVPVAHARVVYGKSGMHLAAALLTDERAVIDHTLYWAAVVSMDEGRYLVGVLNSPSLTELARPYMSYGKDERHIDKHVWKLPIPAFDDTNETHLEIARISSQLAIELAEEALRSTYFVTIRRDLRARIASSELGRELDELVRALLGREAAEDTEPPAIEVRSEGRLIRTTSGPAPVTRADVEIDVDCEFDTSGAVYLWGALVSEHGHPTSYRAFGSSDASFDETAIADDFATWLIDFLDQASERGFRGAWFHYGQAEAQQLRRILGDDAEPLLERATDLLTDVIRPNFYASLGYGLKALGPGAGAEWRTDGATGADTFEWIAAARAGNDEAWVRLVQYNEDDTRANQVLRSKLVEAVSAGWVLP